MFNKFITALRRVTDWAIKLLLIGIAAIGITLGTLLLWLWVGVFYTDLFDHQRWSKQLKDSDDALCYRGGMAGDLKIRVLKHGMHQDEVLRLLGKPDFHEGAEEYQYSLGLCSGIDYDRLQIYFDSNRLVRHVSIISD